MAVNESFCLSSGENLSGGIEDSFETSSSLGFGECVSNNESLHRSTSYRGSFGYEETLLAGSLSATSLGGSCDPLTSRFDVYCGTTVGSAGSGTPSIVRLKNGVVQWATLPRNKRSTTTFTEAQADSLLEACSNLPLDLVITAKLKLKANKQGKEEVVGFVVLGAQTGKLGRNGGPLLSTLNVHFSKATSPKLCEEWVHSINNGLTAMGLRPRKLLFFINPMAGKGDAALIYQQSVRPYLKAASVEADVMLLNGPGSMRKYLSDPTRDVSQYDGIVAVGGDGTINELINISLYRAVEAQVQSQWTTSDIRRENPEVPEHEFSIEQIRKEQHRIGVIPAGSINHIACSVFGSDSPTVATIHTLLGAQYLMDVCSLSVQNCLLTFGTTAIFSCLQGNIRSPKPSKRKLLRLSSSQQLNPIRPDNDFYASLRFQMASSEVVIKRKSSTETWSSDPNASLSPQTTSPVHEPPVSLESSPVEGKWSSLMGTFGYLCIFATPYRDPESPAASSQEGLLDLLLTDGLSRKDLRSAIKRKFSSDQPAPGAVLCHAQQMFINLTLPGNGLGGELTFRRRSHSHMSSPIDMVKPVRGGSTDDTSEEEGGTKTSNCDGTIYNSVDVDFNVTIGLLKGIAWSSMQELAGEASSQTVTSLPPGAFAWFIDGDPIDATSVHVCMLPKIVNFLAMPLINIGIVR